MIVKMTWLRSDQRPVNIAVAHEASTSPGRTTRRPVWLLKSFWLSGGTDRVLFPRLIG
jgi:hypothetical protein